jgi:hypothetical protein
MTAYAEELLGVDDLTGRNTRRAQRVDRPLEGVEIDFSAPDDRSSYLHDASGHAVR